MAAFLGIEWREQRVDGGVDLVFRGWTLDVKWSPTVPYRPDRKPEWRFNYAALKVPSWKPLRAALYVAVHGSVIPVDMGTWAITSLDNDAMKLYGFAFRSEVMARPPVSFGHTNYRGEDATMHVVELQELHSREVLRNLPPFDPERHRQQSLDIAFAAVEPGWAY